MGDLPKNPYNWRNERPRHRVSRQALLAEVLQEITAGVSGYLVGCRGMGKSVFMRELEERLKEQTELDVVVLPRPPAELSVSGMIRALVTELSKKIGRNQGDQKHTGEVIKKLEQQERRQSISDIIDTYLQATDGIERLVLLYDELDGYAGAAGKGFFNELESIRKNAEGQFVVFAAGGVGLISLDTFLGSSFFSRLEPHVLEPFTRDELVELAAPFGLDRDEPLSDEMIDTLRLMSGGHGLLATYGLQHLWEQSSLIPSHIEAALGGFRVDRDNTFNHIRGPVFGLGDLPRAPGVVWAALERAGGKIEQAELRRLVIEHRGEHSITPKWVLMVLRATGLIRCGNSAHVAPLVEVDIIPSILTYSSSEDAPPVRESLRDQLVTDLSGALIKLHRSALAFTRSISKGGRAKDGATSQKDTKAKNEKREPLEEEQYSGIIAVILQCNGWRTEREAESAAGKTDIKAHHPSFGEQAVVIEVKIWPRNDYEHIHEQVQDYWAEGVEALATVMISTLRKTSWKHDYRTACLDGKAETISEVPCSDAIAGHFTASSRHEAVAHVDHFLLRFPVR